MNGIWLGLAGGAAGFAHCLGMCGGFTLHLARGESRRGVLGRQLLWHAGRISAYAFLGAMAGFAGGALGAQSGRPWIQDAMAYAAGAVLILMGARLLGLWPRWRRRPAAGEGLLTSLFRQFFGEPTPTGALALGLATGFLPCPVVLGFLALSAQTGSALAGMTMMAAVGIGAAWSLLLLGMTGHLLSVSLRRWGAVFGGAVLVLLGSATILRGTAIFHQVLGCHTAAQVDAGGQPADAAKGVVPACCGCQSNSGKAGPEREGAVAAPAAADDAGGNGRGPGP